MEIFSKGNRIARFDAQTAHRMALNRKNGHEEVWASGPEAITLENPYELSP